MTFQVQNFFEAMEGYWITKKTIYSINNKKLFNYQENIYYMHNIIYDCNYKQNYSSIILNKQIKSNICYINKKIQKKFLNQYKYKKTEEDLIKLHISKYNLDYIEYIYNISMNFKISIGILKYTNNYIAIIFTSYIKKIP